MLIGAGRGGAGRMDGDGGGTGIPGDPTGSAEFTQESKTDRAEGRRERRDELRFGAVPESRERRPLVGGGKVWFGGRVD